MNMNPSHQTVSLRLLVYSHINLPNEYRTLHCFNSSFWSSFILRDTVKPSTRLKNFTHIYQLFCIWLIHIHVTFLKYEHFRYYVPLNIKHVSVFAKNYFLNKHNRIIKIIKSIFLKCSCIICSHSSEVPSIPIMSLKALFSQVRIQSKITPCLYLTFTVSFNLKHSFYSLLFSFRIMACFDEGRNM